ncbi:MAG: IS66 family transposase [Desulfovibrionales bacterium]|nr:IS66 family transposase [Desulfovibrionales bacterium]
MEERDNTIKRLEAMLRAYDNSNTPSSKKLPGSKTKPAGANEAGAKAKKKKQGGQKGHAGRTSKPKPTRFEDHAPKKCPRCDGGRLRTTSVAARNITDRKVTTEVTTTCHTINTCECTECGLEGIKPDMRGVIPDEGGYGIGVISDVVSSYERRMPVRMISDNSLRDIGVDISAGSVCNILSRVGSRLGRPSEQILESLRRADILHMDETSFSVNGGLYWVWIIYNPDTQEAYFAIRPSRGADVIRELLPGWRGTMVCDGWSSYKTLERLQRCWAHIIREARHLAGRNRNDADARQVLKLLRRVYRDAKRKRLVRDRQRDHGLLTSRVRRMISKYRGVPLLESFMTKLRNALPHLFTFVLDPRVPSTNNAAERGLREIIVHRKIRGGMKSVNTPRIMGNIFTCLTTWKTRGIDHLAEMAKYL